MNFRSFLVDIIPLSEDNLINYISTNRNAIKKIFLKEWDSKDNKSIIEKIVLFIATRSFTTAQLNSDELQSLYVHLAYYFKRIKSHAFLTTCYTYIKDPYFELRLRAFRTYHKNQNYEEHILNFPSYLDLLSKAQDKVDDGNYNEILSDLNEYVHYVHEKLPPEYRTRFNELLDNEELKTKYNILDLYDEKNATLVPGLGVEKYKGKEYEPSDFALALFEEKFVSIIRAKSQPYYPSNLLGYPSNEVRNDIIGCGQTDFDSKYKNLEAIDRVNLYCYFNMRMHFFSSLSIFERSNLAASYYNTSGKIKFIDVGCGPATSGIAFAEYLFQVSGENVIFDYIGVDVSNNMLDKAMDMLDNSIFDPSNKTVFVNSINEINDIYIEDANCIVINCCYVFASSTLNFVEIANFINQLKASFPYITKYLMFQNPVQEKFNTNYFKFKDLIQYDEEWSGYEDIYYYNGQNSFYNAKSKPVYYEILRIS